jgi:hypothetical protein
VNPYLWPLPIFCGSGKPIGDGIYWPTVQGMKELADKKKQQEKAALVRKNDIEMHYQN